MNVWKKTESWIRNRKLLRKKKSWNQNLSLKMKMKKNPKRWHIKTFGHVTKKNFNEPTFPHLNRWCCNQSFHSSVPLFSTFTLLRIYQLTYLQARCQEKMPNMENVTYGMELIWVRSWWWSKQKSKQVNKISQIWKRGWPKFEVLYPLIFNLYLSSNFYLSSSFQAECEEEKPNLENVNNYMELNFKPEDGEEEEFLQVTKVHLNRKLTKIRKSGFILFHQTLFPGWVWGWKAKLGPTTWNYFQEI